MSSILIFYFNLSNYQIGPYLIYLGSWRGGGAPLTLRGISLFYFLIVQDYDEVKGGAVRLLRWGQGVLVQKRLRTTDTEKRDQLLKSNLCQELNPFFIKSVKDKEPIATPHALDLFTYTILVPEGVEISHCSLFQAGDKILDQLLF